jgi:hypothetical protein
MHRRAAAKKITINPENFLAETLDIIVDEAAGRLTAYRCEFDFAPYPTINDPLFIIEGFNVFHFDGGQRDPSPICVVERITWRGRVAPWEARAAGVEAGLCRLDNESPYVAAARYIANVL